MHTMTEGSVEPPQLYATTMETAQVEDESVPEIIEENTSPALEASTGEDAAKEKSETFEEELPIADSEIEVDSATLAEEKEEDREESDVVDVVEELAVAPEEKLDIIQDCPESEVDASKAENVAEVAIVEPSVDPVADEVVEESTQQVKVEEKPATQLPQTERLSDSAGTAPLILTLPIDSLPSIALTEVAIVEPLVDPVADGVVKESTQHGKVEEKPVTQTPQTERLGDSAGTTPLILALPIDSLPSIALAEVAIVEPLVDPVADAVVKETTQQVKVGEKPGTQTPQTERLSDIPGTTPLILTLPIDSLHCIASFLAPGEWASFGRSGKGSSRVCREIFRRVRMHGFRCATEVVTAWKLGQHADAKELCALYVEAGVPIYPHCLGHSYHTLVWRMGVEGREMQRTATEGETAGNDAAGERGNNYVNNDAFPQRRPIDRFYAERYETRTREGHLDRITYLEEKSLYWLNADPENREATELAANIRRQLSFTPNRLFVRHLNVYHQAPHVFHQGANAGGEPPLHQPQIRLPAGGFSTPRSNQSSPRRNIRRSNSHSDLLNRTPKVMVKVHRHLLDQHLLGRRSVDDMDGTMTTASVSLSTDFFHPHFSIHSPSSRCGPSPAAVASPFEANGGFVSGELLPAWGPRTPVEEPIVDLEALSGRALEAAIAPLRQTGDQLAVDEIVGIEDSDSEGEPALQQLDAIAANDAGFDPLNDHVVPAPQAPLAPPPLQIATPGTPLQAEYNVLSNVYLEVYSAASTSPKADSDNPENRDLKNHLQTRFAVYHRRLETLLQQDDSVGFEECVLDFWDEFLPQTANIHYYDRHTAVPRISCLHKFLTKPCPKALGIVQCEIERIKLGSKKKGVGMKGRFFPTYEYRLFIRHHTSESTDEDAEQPERRDTVLMMAKNRGRKHAEAAGPAPSTPSGKKGANNYYLYLPQQADVDDHFKIVNKAQGSPENIPNGAGENRMSATDSSNLLGRLQSNFIGTEFQIFSPRLKKRRDVRAHGDSSSSGKANAASSDDDFDYDSGISSDNASSSSRRRSRFGRLSLRRSSLSHPEEQRTILEGESLDQVNPARRSMRRSKSSNDVSYSKPPRTSRRAIANTADAPAPQRVQDAPYEEEDGAITYTANLLGSRPRIMDVCIPKVSTDGAAGAEWKTYLNKCDDLDAPTGSKMLNRFKQLQQRMENDEQPAGQNSNEPVDVTSDEGDTYTPPDDFGLLALQNRPPWWNIELGSFVLNFGGRVSVASVKNFQLCDRNDQDYIMLQFGRIQGRHSFTMDFQHPLTAVQAFAIAISSLQSKISFG